MGRLSQLNEADGASAMALLVEFSLPSQPGNERQAMQRVAEAVQALHLPPAQLERLKTAVAETTMNAMEYGNQYQADRPVWVRVYRTGGSLVVRITDQGSGLEGSPPAEPDIDAKLAGVQGPRGWGLFLIRNMVDEVRTIDDAEGHTVELVLDLPGWKMEAKTFEASVRHEAGVAIIDLVGEINTSAEEALSAAYDAAETRDPATVALNFNRVGYINSTGIALLIGLLARAREARRQLVVYGLTEHYAQIFELTRLSDFMEIVPDEASALSEAQGARPDRNV